jgi:hypothetical protein
MNSLTLVPTMRDLLTLLCQYPCDISRRDELSVLLRKVTDWPKTVELINAHGIIALAAYNIKVYGLQKEIPEPSMKLLEDGYMKSVTRNTWLTERWKDVNTILNNAGIKHVLLKGMALEHTLYGSRGLRQMTDNDILIRQDDAIKAWLLLQENGFSHELIKSPLHKNIMADIGKHLPALYKNGYAVEIHHKLFGHRKDISGSGDPVDSAIEVDINGTKGWILSKEFQMMHLIDHFEKHAREGAVQMRQYADIILLDKKSGVEISDSFIADPLQFNKPEYRRAAYKEAIRYIKPEFRLRYIAGDIFPSVEWMKDRYRCRGIKALLYYPLRMGKLLWLL